MGRDGPVRLHEHQSKALFAEHGIPIPRGDVASTPEDARRTAMDLGGAVAVKAQVLAGGRGKAGGVRLARTALEAEKVAAALLGTRINGLPVDQVLVEEAVDIRQEVYLSAVIDRGLRQAVMVASSQGGIEIEQVARDYPEAIYRTAIDPATGLGRAHTHAVAIGIGLADGYYESFDGIARGLYKAFATYDALLAEINPLVITGGGELVALDGKVVIDDNALFRQPGLREMAGTDSESALEREARGAGLSYVHLGGEIGCVVNGAGLAMATMDVIRLFGGDPANFLDVGGGAGADKVAVALRLVLATPGLRAALVNIFGGITLCDEVARGIVTALDEAGSHVPLIVRLVGTNEEQGHEILRDSGHRLIAARTLAEAARVVVSVADGELEV
jgi:succinyl-CoA synthetase beta subunit